MEKARRHRWCFTRFEEKEPEYDSGAMRYLVYQREQCPDTGRRHWQGYIEFTAALTMRRVKFYLGDTCHLEIAKGDAAANTKYCTKSDSRVRETEPCIFGRPQPNHQGARADLESLRADALDESKTEYEVATTSAAYPRHMRYFQRMRYLHGQFINSKLGFSERHVTWYHGAPGLGKSRRAMYEARAASRDGRIYRKPSDAKWWDGYDGENCVIIDDISGDSGMAVGTWKRLLDGFAEQIEVKHGYVPWRATHIWITSNYSPEEWFSQVSQRLIDHAALRRRITKVCAFTTEWTPPPDPPTTPPNTPQEEEAEILSTFSFSQESGLT